MRSLSLAEKMAMRKKSAHVVDSPIQENLTSDASNQAIGSSQSSDLIDSSVIFIALDLIDIENQVRDKFDLEHIQDLACDFALASSKQPKQPITVFTRGNGRYLLDNGENRTRAMRYASENRVVLNSSNPADFTSIRATVVGPEPSELDRKQSQVKENVLRDNLKPVELGKAVQTFLKQNPSATHTDAAEWVGFKNKASGRVIIANALKLLMCDADIIGEVESQTISAKSALKVQSLRARQDNNKSEKAFKKAKTKTKSHAIHLSLNSLKIAAKIIQQLSLDKGILVDSTAPPDRKAIMTFFSEENLKGILDKVN